MARPSEAARVGGRACAEGLALARVIEALQGGKGEGKVAVISRGGAVSI